MDLQPDTTPNASPGHWTNRDWHVNSPGLFAVIIGVSNYKHLAEGEAPSPEACDLKLKQLTASALTGYHVFDWLRTHYSYDEAALAECWLLLSPTPAEVEIESEIKTHQADPTFANCSSAIKYWRRRMLDLPKPSAEKSRALFFFSGHGVEIHHQTQILLPSNYLGPPDFDAFNEAINPWNLHKALASTSIPNQFFFIDACRNDDVDLRGKDIKGATILQEHESAHAHSRVAPIFYATEPGMEAYSPTDPNDGLSLFGQALVDGLCGTPHIEINRERGSASIDVYPLQQYMKAHMAAKLQAMNASVSQSVNLMGSVDNAPITLIKQGASTGQGGDVFRGEVSFGVDVGPPQMLSLPSAPSALSQSAGDVWRTRPVMGQGAGRQRSLAEEVHDDRERLYPISRTPDVDLAHLKSSLDIGHDAFGSETITKLWTSATTVFGLDRKQQINPASVTITRVDRDLRLRGQRIFLTINDDDPKGHWLQLGDLDSRYFGCVLPTNLGKPINYILEMSLEKTSNDDRRLVSIKTYLSADNEQPLADAALIWHHNRVAHFGAAIDTFRQSRLRATLRDPSMLDGQAFTSPLAAAIVASLLLRANRFSELQNDAGESWLLKLAETFDDVPDLAVLHAAELGYQASAENDASGDWLSNLHRLGLPYTTEAIGLASEHIQSARSDLDDVKKRIWDAMKTLADDSLFAVYAHIPSINPTDLIGALGD